MSRILGGHMVKHMHHQTFFPMGFASQMFVDMYRLIIKRLPHLQIKLQALQQQRFKEIRKFHANHPMWATLVLHWYIILKASAQ